MAGVVAPIAHVFFFLFVPSFLLDTAFGVLLPVAGFLARDGPLLTVDTALPGASSAAAGGGGDDGGVPPETAEEAATSTPWVACMASNGHPYWYNTRTGVSRWELPPGGHADAGEATGGDDAATDGLAAAHGADQQWVWGLPGWGLRQHPRRPPNRQRPGGSCARSSIRLLTRGGGYVRSIR